MEVHRGQAQKVRFLTHASGDDGSVVTDHIATLELNGMAVQVTADRPPTIESGDDVVVAGEMRRGVFTGYACYNHTRETLDYRTWIGFMVAGLVFLAVGIAGTVVSAMELSPLALFFMSFAAAGTWAAARSMRIVKAKSLVCA